MSQATNLRQKAPGPFYVRSIRITKALKQLLFFRSRSNDEGYHKHTTRQQEEPIRSSQGVRKDAQCHGIVERVPVPAIRTAGYERVNSPGYHSIREILSEVAERPNEQTSRDHAQTDSRPT